MAYICKASDGRTTSIRLRYSHIPFKKLVSQLFYMSHTNECFIFAIARRRLLELTSDSFQSLEKVTGAPHAVRGLLPLAVGSIDEFLAVRMCGFSAVTGTIIIQN